MTTTMHLLITFDQESQIAKKENQVTKTSPWLLRWPCLVVWHSSVCLSCWHTHCYSPGGSKRHSQHTFRPGSEDRHVWFFQLYISNKLHCLVIDIQGRDQCCYVSTPQMSVEWATDAPNCLWLWSKPVCLCTHRVCFCHGLRRTVCATELVWESAINWSR